MTNMNVILTIVMKYITSVVNRKKCSCVALCLLFFLCITFSDCHCFGSDDVLMFEEIFPVRELSEGDKAEVNNNVRLKMIVIANVEYYTLLKLGVDESKLIFHGGFVKWGDQSYVSEDGGFFCCHGLNDRGYDITIVYYHESVLSQLNYRLKRKKEKLQREGECHITGASNDDVRVSVLDKINSERFSYKTHILHDKFVAKSEINMPYRYVSSDRFGDKGFEGTLCLTKKKPKAKFNYSEKSMAAMALFGKNENIGKGQWIAEFNEGIYMGREIDIHHLTVFNMNHVLWTRLSKNKLVYYKQEIPRVMSGLNEMVAYRKDRQACCGEQFASRKIRLKPAYQLFFSHMFIQSNGSLCDALIAFQSTPSAITLASRPGGSIVYQCNDHFGSGEPNRKNYKTWSDSVNDLWANKVIKVFEKGPDDMIEGGGFDAIRPSPMQIEVDESVKKRLLTMHQAVKRKQLGDVDKFESQEKKLKVEFTDLNHMAYDKLRGEILTLTEQHSSDISRLNCKIMEITAEKEACQKTVTDLKDKVYWFSKECEKRQGAFEQCDKERCSLLWSIAHLESKASSLSKDVEIWKEKYEKAEVSKEAAQAASELGLQVWKTSCEAGEKLLRDQEAVTNELRCKVAQLGQQVEECQNENARMRYRMAQANSEVDRLNREVRIVRGIPQPPEPAYEYLYPGGAAVSSTAAIDELEFFGESAGNELDYLLGIEGCL